jgi:hypothetical protein
MFILHLNAYGDFGSLDVEKTYIHLAANSLADFELNEDSFDDMHDVDIPHETLLELGFIEIFPEDINYGGNY